MTGSRDKIWFERIGRWMNKVGMPATGYIDKLYARWLDRVHLGLNS